MNESASGITAGGLLRAAREKQGLHIAALAAAIKVSPRKLDALENDRLSELPDATFTRALAQTVCRQLKIDARPVLDLLPTVGGAALEHAKVGLNTPFRERSGRDDTGLAIAAIRPMVWAASVLMLAAVVVYFLPEGVLDGISDSVSGVAAPAASSAASAVLASPATAVPTPAVVALVAPSAVTAPASAGETSVAAAPPGAAASAAPAPGAPAVETVFAAPPAASAVAGVVQLRSSEPSWVEARDGAGQLLLSRTVQPGESLGLDGRLPIRLTVGNAAATQVSFRGQAIDLRQRTRDNVARVELQ